jgi:hypothetical protein
MGLGYGARAAMTRGLVQIVYQMFCYAEVVEKFGRREKGLLERNESRITFAAKVILTSAK